MKQYKNLGGNSSVLAYEIGSGSITIEFSDHWKYTYTSQSAGLSNIEEMKQLAQQGIGLNSFIMKRVKKSYARKFR